MKLICDKCGEEFESGLVNVLEHQFEKCKAHYTEKVGEVSVKYMPFIHPKPKESDDFKKNTT